jgi:ribosomal protein S20
MKTTLAISILVVLLGSGCGPVSTDFWKNQGINYAIRSDIKELNARVIESINNNDLKGFNVLLSDSLKHFKKVDVDGFFKKYRDEIKGKSVSIFKGILLGNF